MKGYVYILHFHEKLAHAQHYIGWSQEDPLKEGGRIEAHRSGRGAKITQALKVKGIGFDANVIGKDVDRNYERKLKNQKNGKRFCPICNSTK